MVLPQKSFLFFKGEILQTGPYHIEMFYEMEHNNKVCARSRQFRKSWLPSSELFFFIPLIT